MTIDMSSVGQPVAPVEHDYTWRDVSLYAQALGAGTDDLGYVLDQPPPKVLPTYGVIPAFVPVFDAMRKTGGDLVQLLHTSQRTELIRPFPASGRLRTRASIRGIWDMRIGALALVDTETDVNGELACKTTWQLLLRGEGGFGGERPPAGLRTKPPKDRAPDFEVSVPTSRNQALLYRLTGDVNPIHSHPEVAKMAGFDRPILHGLCTYGVAARVALKALAGDEPARFRAFEAKFAKPVMPGDTLVVRGYRLEEAGQAAITVDIAGSTEQPIANALFEYQP
jgi:acyl dehydratase